MNRDFNVQSIRGHPPTSPNLRLPQKMALMIDQRSLRCAEQHWLPSNTTKYCTCHEFKIWMENAWIASAKMKTNRPWSDDNPTIKSSSRTHRFGDLTRPILERHFVWKNATFRLRLSPKISRNAAPATKSHTPPSPNIAPATKTHSHNWSSSHMTSPNAATATRTHTPPSPITVPATKNALYSSLLFSTSLFSTHLFSTLLLYSLRINYLFHFLKLRNSEVSDLNFLWQHT